MADAVAHVLGTIGTGGVPRVAHELLRRLPARWDRHLYYLTDRCADPDARDRQVAGLRAEGIDVRLVPAAVARDKAAAVDLVAHWVAEDGVRVVHTHSTRPNRSGRLAALAVPGVRTVAHYHNHYDDKWGEGSQALALERSLLPRTDRLVACSESVRDHLVERLGADRDAVVVLPNGVTAGEYAAGDGSRVRRELGTPDDVTVLGSVGRLCAQKAPDDVLRAAAAVLATHPRAELWMVGSTSDTAMLDRLRTLAALLGIGPRVRFLGQRHDMADVYAALDVMVLASRWEGFGLVVAEAMAAGVPVVATDVGGIGEAVGAAAPQGPAARLVDAGDPGRVPDLLAAAVLGLLADPAATAQQVARGRERAAVLGWERAASGLDALYADLLAAPAPAGTVR